MKYYTIGFIFFFLSLLAILVLLYFGSITRQVEKDIDLIKSKINILNDKLKVNELEYSAYINPGYLNKLSKVYLIQDYDKNVELNIVDIQVFKTNRIHKIYKVRKN